MFSDSTSRLLAQPQQYITSKAFEKTSLILGCRVEDQVSEANLDIFLCEPDMIVRVSRDAAQFLDGIRPNCLTVLLGHFRRIDFLIKQRRDICPCPVFPVHLNG